MGGRRDGAKGGAAGRPAGSDLTRRVLLAGAASLASGTGLAAPAEPGRTMLVTHAAFAAHETGPSHPERPARMRALDEVLAGPSFAGLRREAAPLREDAEAAILRAHAPAHLAAIRALAADPGGLPARIGPDTVVSAGTWEAALRAVGAGLRAVDAVCEGGSVRNAFCQVRPPGHHAERARAMGFCLFDTAAVAALHARARHGARRVAVVDFDVHHGNGTQDIFWSDPDLFYASTHRMPWFPGTGAASERGVGNIWNAPLKEGDGAAPFRAAWAQHLLPALDAFRPDLIVVSAGFDAHEGDPLGGLRLQAADFGWITAAIAEVAERCCGGRIVSLLEGGYRLDALAASGAAHVRALLEAG
ncbi:histone deacetylase family protein [Methylobacterium durans]|uniref:Acetoin utilization protein n=1 Tax=Methylobacterium durans TaxID=2202825 RepID=A0A2U8W3F0_9HYPH|nr:histone deacetylase family protein [Methylobacterium durans]AWN40188.1 acetoin utilization protein [Methylobacterium durans]